MAEKILIIDDDLDTLKLVGLMLQKQGYRIIAATNGEEGLAHAEIENPDLVLLDVMMPEMDGYEVARRLRAKADTALTPILMFTARSQLDDKVTGFESGVDDYLTKPTSPAELTTHVKALLARSGKARQSIQAAPAEPRAFTIGVLAAHGGQGVTTTAVNLGDAVRRITNSDAIVAELRPGMGTLGADLGEANPQLLTQLLIAKPAEITPERIKENLFVLDDGLRILFGSIQPKDGTLANALGQLNVLVNRLSYLASYLILDLGAGLTPLVEKLIPQCDSLIVLVEPVTNSVLRAKSLIAALAELSGKERKIHALVVNRVRSETQLDTSQLIGLLGQSLLGEITPAPELIHQAALKKTTVVSAQSDSLLAQQFTQIAQNLAELEKIRQ